jgi:flagellar basal-body rod modification protein FlgD
MTSPISAASILTTSQYEEEQLTRDTSRDDMGRDAFLKLFTTQLNNQDPLNPMENEAFVAQLAQFSTLEANYSIRDSMDAMVGGMQRDQMLAGANLVGKSVAVEGGFFNAEEGAITSGSIDLESGADSVTMSVYDSAGELVYRETTGNRLPGKVDLNWNGMNLQGQMAPGGDYIMAASVTRNGKLESVPVTTLAKVRSVNWNPVLQEMALEIGDGSLVSMADVKRISM